VPDGLESLPRLYNGECAQVVKASPGNIDCYLLEPTDGSSSVTACTVWQSEAAAEAYEASGAAQQAIGRGKTLLGAPPTLHSFGVVRSTSSSPPRSGGRPCPPPGIGALDGQMADPREAANPVDQAISRNDPVELAGLVDREALGRLNDAEDYFHKR